MVSSNGQFHLESPAFRDGEPIPVIHTGEGLNLSQPLRFLNILNPAYLNFSSPLAWGALNIVAFGIASVLGVIAGSALFGLSAGRFRWEGFASLADLRDQLIGAMLMGFGGVTALGCTVGQGLSGLSTLAIGSFIAVAGIVAGSVAMLKYTLWREERS